MKLASHLWVSPFGVYYLRYFKNGIDTKKSLRTKNVTIARQKAYEFGVSLMQIDPKNLKNWKLTVGDYTIETDGSDNDHKQALEVVALFNQSQNHFAMPQQKSVNEITFEDAIEKYFDNKKNDFGESTKRTYFAAISKLSNYVGSKKLLNTVNAEIVTKFRQSIELTLAPKTLKRDFNAIKNFFIWASAYEYYNKLNPVIPFKISQRELSRRKERFEKPRNPFTKEDLDKIFEIKRYSEIEKPCAFWLPIIGLYFGARIGDLCEILTSDFTDKGNNTYSIKIRNIKIDGKESEKKREIPLHPDLIEIGFIEYVNDVENAFGKGLIFPNLKPGGKNGLANLPGRDFSNLKTKLGLGDDKVFHSFRKTTISCLQFNQCDIELRRAYVGHAEGDDNIDVHLKDYSKAEMFRVLCQKIPEKLNFKNWLDFEINGIKYKKNQFNDYMKKMKTKHDTDKLREERSSRIKSTRTNSGTLKL